MNRRKATLLIEQKAAAHPVAFSFFAAAVFLAAWEGLVGFLKIPSYLLPPPSAIIGRTYKDFGLIGRETFVTLIEVLAGFVSGVLAGFALGIAIVHSKATERALMPLVLFFQTTPKLAVAPLFLIWFGYGLLPKVLIVLLMCLFPILVNCVSGLQSTDARLLELMTVLEASWWQVLWKVRFPGALPQFFAGLKVAITLSVIGAVVGEWVGASEGLGHLILVANSQVDTELTFACVAVLAAMGAVLFALVQEVEKRYLSWSAPIEVAGTV
jgi:NitT/TauT family transport system permease protein